MVIVWSSIVIVMRHMQMEAAPILIWYEWRDVGRSYQNDGTLWSESASLPQNGGSGGGGSSSRGNTTPEGKKINEIYDALITSPEFKKLFIGEIRDLVTSSAGRTILETEYTMRPTAITNPSVSTPCIWNEYYKYLSLQGLGQTNFYKDNFLKGSDQLYLYGHKELKS